MEVGNLKRNHYAGKLDSEQVGKKVCVAGWVDVRRDLGGLIFVDLRDSTGKVQLVADPNRNKEVHEQFSGLKSEYVIIAEGVVTQRPQGSGNSQAATGQIEIYPDSV